MDIIKMAPSLKVFISSKMTELRDVREVVGRALKNHGLEAVIYETSVGAQPESVLSTSLRLVEEADIYVGIFWKEYGEITIEEYIHAKKHNKPCFIYLRDKDVKRSDKLEKFLDDEVFNLKTGVTYAFFDRSLDLAEAMAEDITTWFVRKYRELSSQANSQLKSKEELKNLQREIKRLTAISNYPLKEGDQVDNLGRQLREWFEAVGYSIEKDITRNDNYADLVINVPSRRKCDRVLVRAISGKIEFLHVQKAEKIAKSNKYDEIWIITERRISQFAREQAEEKSNIFLYTFDELIDEFVDFSNYFDWLEREIKRKNILEYYIPLAGSMDVIDIAGNVFGKDDFDSIEIYLDKWLESSDKRHISILGEFGTGKTWLILHYAYQKMLEFKKLSKQGRRRSRIPLVISLRNYAQGFKDVGALLSEFVFREHEIGLPSYRAFEQLNKMGRILLIFDGFDEMADRVDRQKMVNNFWEIAKACEFGSKVILTCRTEHFHFARQERDILTGCLKPSTYQFDYPSISFEIIHIKMFSKSQIRAALEKRTNSETIKMIFDIHELLDNAQRPLLVELILDALDKLDPGSPISLASIYFYSVINKMKRDIKNKRTFTSLADKIYFLCELAWEMYSTNQLSINYKQFPKRVQEYFGLKVSEIEEDHWQYDLLSQTMLIRDGDGNYSPAHRSILEFLVAYKLVAEMGVLADRFMKPFNNQKESLETVDFKKHTWSTFFINQGTTKTKIESFAMEEMPLLAETIGKKKLDKALVILMKDMIETKLLWDVIYATRRRTIDEVRWVGCNTIELLVALEENINGKDFSETVLPYAEFPETKLININFKNANLEGVKFCGPLINVNFEGARLSNFTLSFSYTIKNLSWSPNNKYLVAGDDKGNIWVWNTAKWEVLWFIPGHYKAISCIAWTRDNNVFASGSFDGTILFWNIETKKCVAHIDKNSPICDLSFNKEGNLLACACADGYIGIWEKSNLAIPFLNLDSVTLKNSLIHLLKDSKTIIENIRDTFEFDKDISDFEEDDEQIKLFELLKTASELEMDNKAANQILENIDIESFGFNPFVSGVCWHPNGREIFASSFGWINTNPVGNFDFFFETPQTVKKADLQTGNLIDEFAFHENQINSLKISNDGTLLFTGSDDHSVICWDIETHKAIWQLKHEEGIKIIAINHEANIGASGSGAFMGHDAELKVWNMKDGELLFATLPKGRYLVALSFNKDGTLLASGSYYGQIKVFDVNPLSVNFSSCLKVIEGRGICQGTSIAGAKELSDSGLERLYREGALLDDEQKRRILGML